MRDGAREAGSCDPALISCFIRSCLCLATGVQVIHRRMQTTASERSGWRSLRGPSSCLHLCKATPPRALLWFSGAVAGGKMNLSRVMPLGAFLASPSLPSFQSQTIF